jgi:hypothetical protein
MQQFWELVHLYGQLRNVEYIGKRDHKTGEWNWSNSNNRNKVWENRKAATTQFATPILVIRNASEVLGRLKVATRIRVMVIISYHYLQFYLV